MKNKLPDLNNHLFTALERLNAEDMTDEQIKTEISRCQAVGEIGKVIIDGAKTELLKLKLTGKLSEPQDEEEGKIKLFDRPKSEYSNDRKVS